MQFMHNFSLSMPPVKQFLSAALVTPHRTAVCALMTQRYYMQILNSKGMAGPHRAFLSEHNCA